MLVVKRFGSFETANKRIRQSVLEGYSCMINMTYKLSRSGDMSCCAEKGQDPIDNKDIVKLFNKLQLFVKEKDFDRDVYYQQLDGLCGHQPFCSDDH